MPLMPPSVHTRASFSRVYCLYCYDRCKPTRLEIWKLRASLCQYGGIPANWGSNAKKSKGVSQSTHDEEDE